MRRSSRGFRNSAKRRSICDVTSPKLQGNECVLRLRVSSCASVSVCVLGVANTPFKANQSVQVLYILIIVMRESEKYIYILSIDSILDPDCRLMRVETFMPLAPASEVPVPAIWL